LRARINERHRRNFLGAGTSTRSFALGPWAIRERERQSREHETGSRAASEAGRAPVELDQTSVGRLSRMDAMQGREMALAAERRRAAELAKIDAALRRLEIGEYGFCVKCGEPIGEKRLALDPAAATCIKCA
jgi:DnaK suppressor protein